MELVVHKDDLLPELQLIQGIVERKNTIPILANVLFKAKTNDVEMRATDLEVALFSSCAAKVKKSGVVTLPAKTLFEVVRALPETNITIKQQGQNTVMVEAETTKGKKFISSMQTLPEEDFPTLAEPKTKQAVKLPGQPLREMIARTKFAITGEDTRYFLNGALFFKDASEMTMVGTDGHRLALVSMKSIKSGKSPKNPDVARVIFPKKTLQELSSLLTDNDKEISYQEEENHLFFNVGGRTLISRKVDAQFPAYERVIPKDSDKAVEFERDRLNQAIKRVALLSNERSSAVTFKIGNDVVDITSSRQDVGEASEKIEVEYGGDSVQICLNAKYVLDFLNVVETDNVRLEFRNETSQAVMQPVGAEGYQYTYVIMPMRI